MLLPKYIVLYDGNQNSFIFALGKFAFPSGKNTCDGDDDGDVFFHLLLNGSNSSNTAEDGEMVSAPTFPRYHARKGMAGDVRPRPRLGAGLVKILGYTDSVNGTTTTRRGKEQTLVIDINEIPTVF